MAHTYLPPELRHLIFSALKEDKNSLRSCSLVCKSWREIILVHLFATIASIRARAFEDLEEFFNDRPSIAACVKHLKLEGHTSRVSKKFDIVIRRETIIGILSKLPSLKQLSLDNLRVDADSLADGQNLEGSAPVRIQRLDICRWYSSKAPALPELYALLSPFIVDTLQIGSVFLPRGGIAAAMPGAGVVPVRKLVFRDSQSLYYSLDGLARILNPGSLKAMSAHCSSWGTVECLCTFFREVGRSIEELELGLPPLYVIDRLPRPDWQSLGNAVATLDELEVLSMSGARPEPCVALLSPLRSRRLRRVVLDMGHVDISCFDDPFGHWSAIDEHLTCQKFLCLESVTLAFTRSDGENSTILAGATKALPMLHAAGLLKIEDAELPLITQ